MNILDNCKSLISVPFVISSNEKVRIQIRRAKNQRITPDTDPTGLKSTNPIGSRSSFLIKYWFKLLGLLFLSLFLLIILSVTLWANILYFICTEFLKRIKVSISHHTGTPDWKLISYISYIYIFSPTKNGHIC